MPERIAPRLEAFKGAIDEMLRSDLDAPKKQRHTARRILARLVDEHGATDLSYSTVRDYVGKRRSQILAEAGKPWSWAMCRRPIRRRLKGKWTFMTCG
ncbi:hypothetical protein BZL30_8984 [Mycobacterium kansasii]|uniref:Uncharacterized protein n=1 Tax=Mycobacterium kansasii TaxID=1768 RepID=A0A1V3WDR1_MYCKA|nr:hypothetical protein BZL30_8984 [Mycobacterium kansasii]